MSSRALRKLQREEEERKQAQLLQQDEEEEESDDLDQPNPKQPNAFDMLDAGEEDGDDSPAEDDLQADNGMIETSEAQTQQTQQAKARKKKRKGKKKGKAVQLDSDTQGKDAKAESDSNLDEIDRALKDLSTKGDTDKNVSVSAMIDEANAQLYRLLAVEAKHLNALNEMKRLFGNVVLENEAEASPGPRRRGRGPQTVDLGGALAARNSPVSRGQGLKGLALKRNPLMMGKEEWPQATSGGLGMERVGQLDDGTVEFCFVHSGIYQGTQREFEACVASMDPQRLINMLMFHPYHVSTLLQVSEIAKQQGDHSVAGDLLERTLFTFGRSVHSSFTHNISGGKARLDFRRPENREFWLAAWRYVRDLGQRGTWRTAYEWAKLILSLDPEGDPYCISKVIDQLAIRGGQPEHFISLSQQPFVKDEMWKGLPNIAISKSLAEYRLKQSEACRESLTQAVSEYPWIFVRLLQELNIDHIPKSIWGKSPRTDREKFAAEHYVLSAKDLWSTPEAISFLVEVVETAAPSSPSKPNETPISLDQARVTILSGVNSLINLIPRDFTTLPSTSSDPLPPEDNVLSYDPSPARERPSHPDSELEAAYADLDDHDAVMPLPANNNDGEDRAPAPGGLDIFSRVAQFFNSTVRGGPQQILHPDEELTQALRDSGMEDLLDQEALQAQLADHQDEIPRLQREAEALENVLSSSEEGDRENAVPPERTRPSEQTEQDEQQRLQHFLAGSGITGLKAYADSHSNDSAAWNQPEGKVLLDQYAQKLGRLRNQRTRQFLLRYALPQGAGEDVKRRIESRLA